MNTESRFKGYLQNLRVGKNNTFIILRQFHNTLQVVISSELKMKSDNIPLESIIEIIGKEVPANVISCTIKDKEIHATDIIVIAANNHSLALQIHNYDKIITEIPTILNNRALSLRAPRNNCIFQIQALITKLFRQYFDDNHFMEIHTPKLIKGASESGSQVFSVKYFEETRYLAQSPQLYKQMMINAGYKRVYEIGPIFRAEPSTGIRHLTQFYGLDIEMEIEHNYLEVVHMLYNFLTFLFDTLKTDAKYAELLKATDYSELMYPKEPLILDYWTAIGELEKTGYHVNCRDDINVTDEKQIGIMIKEKYNYDIVIVNKYPKIIRPFYSMPSVDDNGLTNSYDIILRGNEILSGSQRINDYQQLLNSAKSNNINMESLNEYFDSFKNASPQHGGGGFGLERLTMFILNIPNIKLASLFPVYY